MSTVIGRNGTMPYPPVACAGRMWMVGFWAGVANNKLRMTMMLDGHSYE
jgi:hypothetical protein